MYSISLVSLVVVLIFGANVYGHSYVTSPITRTNQAQSQTGCRVDNPNTYGTNGGTNCPGPCDDSGGKQGGAASFTVKRGDQVDLRWARNNHPGGFVRFAWAPTDSSSTNSDFDSYAYRFECFEKGPFCAPSSLSATGDAGTDTQTGCGSNITVPNWVTDGKWTLQWAWFGGFSDLGDYYSCVDYVVSGGNSADSSDATWGNPSYIVFAGGDYANPDKQVCQFRNTDRLHQCVQEDCNANLFQAGVLQTGAPKNTDGSSVHVIDSTYPTASNPQQVSLSSDSSIPCSVDSDCKSGTCQITGFCLPQSTLNAGAIAAIVFAGLVFIVILAIAGFFLLNRKEVPYMVPFKGRI